MPESTEVKRPVITPLRVITALCLIAPFVAMLWVSSYAKTDPALGGIPFFYWYQMLWVFIDALLLWIVYGIVIREDRRRRALIHGPASDDARRASGGSGDRS
jgi:hypothetical protein